MIRRATHIICFTLLLCAAPLCKAESAIDIYTKAAGLYKSGNYTESQKLYEQLLDQGYHQPETYYNLGNCFYKKNQLGKAILNYERALRLSPDDEDIAHNLQLAELKTLDKIQPVPQLAFVTGWKNFVGTHSDGGWSIIALIALWCALIAAVVYLFLLKSRGVLMLSMAALIVSAATLFLAAFQHRQLHDSSYAILVNESINVLSAPDAASGTVFTLHEGTKLLLMDEVSGWHKIRLADGRIGWLPSGMFERI
ncbi:MAG: tetratricopeptide repeat protein [Chitinophagales bacterium]|nr:tetratricopeptide repeat protein [Chitinophagales bacterium]